MRQWAQVASAAIAAFVAAGAGAQALPEAGLLPTPPDLAADVPQDFPRFFFKGHDEQAQLLSRYYWHFFKTRSHFGKGVYYQEYVTTADMWAAGAVPDKVGRPMQRIHRDNLLSIRIDPEGYVHSHQHFSHCHEHGWPFPLWTQVYEGVNGKTAGFHFQEDGPGWMWVWNYLKLWKDHTYYGSDCLKGWELYNLKSSGIVDNKWHLEATGESPALLVPAQIRIDAFQAPFLQLRWIRTGEPPPGVLPYVEWLREEDAEFDEDRRVYFDYKADEEHQRTSGTNHCMIEMYRHPKWTGQIRQIRLALAPGESGVEFDIDSFFTVYDTRHAINNPIFILASWNHFRWTGDVDFLRRNIDRMRLALRHQQTVMGGLEHNHIRNPWPGHDGLSGYVVNADGTKTFRLGHGIGNNYWDILPFGGDDMYATSQYYAATLAMAELEETIREHPGWAVPRGALALDSGQLRKHADAVKATANREFWSEEMGRFVGCIDVEGEAHDYGFTFVNLDAIWYGIASDDHARRIMDWLTGKRTVQGDTSTGEDIYRWRFGPRATTKRNVDWYGQGWTNPEDLPFGAQIQDGGAVLGFSFYDLWARLRVLGPENAWQRLMEILAWEKEVQTEGGYRVYYEGGKRGTTLQGGGSAGGLGIDHEFFESSLLPSIVVYGFLGLEPTGAELRINPKLPESCGEMGVSNLLFRGVRLDIRAGEDSVAVAVKDEPADPLRIVLTGRWRLVGTDRVGSRFECDRPGVYRFESIPRASLRSHSLCERAAHKGSVRRRLPGSW